VETREMIAKTMDLKVVVVFVVAAFVVEEEIPSCFLLLIFLGASFIDPVRKE